MVGKTSMCNQYIQGFKDDNKPTLINEWRGTKKIGGKDVFVVIYDVNGEIHEKDRKFQRTMWY